jgi:cobalt/nickel transport system permease protein
MLVPILAMHIPDGFLSVPVSLVGWVVAVALVGIGLRNTRDQFRERQIPLMGILAAFIFAAQMINFPVAGGTSGHLIGGVLAAILLGPWAALLVMTSVVAVQALIFQDGGLLALGFNLVNMAVLAPFIGYMIYNGLGRLLGYVGGGQLISVAVGAWVSVVVAAAACALQLAVSGTSPVTIVLPAMIGIHLLIGLGEALITVGALTFIGQTRPDLLDRKTQATHSGSGWIAAGMLIALLVALASPLASPAPDGLERVAEDAGFVAAAQLPLYEIVPDYKAPFIEDEALATIIAGVIGVLVVGGVSYGMARVGRRRTDWTDG